MIILPILSLGFLIICLLGALVSFQFFTHYQSATTFDRDDLAAQRRRAQGALGYLVAFGAGAVIALFGFLYPALSGNAPEPRPPAIGDSSTQDSSAASPDSTAVASPTDQIPPTDELPPTSTPTAAPTLPSAYIANTGEAGANIRSVPGLGGTIIAVLAEGTKVFLLGGVDEVDGFKWQEIEMEDTRTGWVVENYLVPDN